MSREPHFMLMPLAGRLSELHRERRDHRAGILAFETVSTMERLCQGMKIESSVETGCGLSTVLLSNLAQSHVAFTYDDREQEDSSVSYAMNNPAFRADACKFHFGATQLTLPGYDLSAGLDFVLIDGPHGFPFPQLEYYFIYPHLRTGALLAIDDINIPHLWAMFCCLAEDDMFEFVHISEAKMGFLRRTATAAPSVVGDDWYIQRHNFKKWPMKIVPDSVWEAGHVIDFTERGNRAAFELLGWSVCESWGSWSDGSEASIGFRWGQAAQQAEYVHVRIFYGARSEVSVLLNGQQVAVIPGYQEDGMQERVFSFPLAGLDHGQASILVFRPAETRFLGDFPNRRLGIAINSMWYEVP